MKYYFFLILIIFFNKTFSQNTDSIKFRDTVCLYIDFDLKYDDLKIINIKSNQADEYTYVFPDAKKITFISYKKGELLDCNIKKKRKNIEKFKKIKIEDIHKLGYRKTIDFIFKNKLIIYIVDKKMLKKRKIVLKRAYMMNSNEVQI